ncbi:MAG: hypothetical protein ACOYYI_09740 [Chloroflexota bacterium]|jgi:hypothetical protein
MDTQKIVQTGFAAALTVLVVVLLFFAGRAYLTGYHTVNGVVVDKAYSPPSTNTTYVVVPDSHPVVNTTSGSEKFILLIDVGGNVESYVVSAETYASANVGDVVPMTCNQHLCAVVEK